jgi:hypothetical protein
LGFRVLPLDVHALAAGAVIGVGLEMELNCGTSAARFKRVLAANRSLLSSATRPMLSTLLLLFVPASLTVTLEPIRDKLVVLTFDDASKSHVGTDQRLGFSRIFDDPKPPVDMAMPNFQGICGRSEP